MSETVTESTQEAQNNQEASPDAQAMDIIKEMQASSQNKDGTEEVVNDPDKLDKALEEEKKQKAAEEQKTEEKKDEETIPEDQRERYSRSLSILQKKEKALQEREAEIKPYITELEEYMQMKDKARMDPVAFLDSLGVSLERFNDFIVNGPKVDKVSLLEEKVNKYEEMLKQKEIDDKQKEEQAQFENNVKAFKNDLSQFVRTNGEKYPYLFSLGKDAEEGVYQMVKEIADKEDRLLPFEEACDILNTELKQYSEKVSAASNKKNEQTINENAPAKDNSQQPKKTLTNNLTSSGTTRELTQEEREEQALKIIQSMTG